MIPTVEDLERAHGWLSRRFARPSTLHPAGARNALAMARDLAPTPAEEPAAVFYALVRHVRALGALGRVLPVVFAVNLTRAQGLALSATEDDLVALFLPIRAQTMSYDEVRAWFAARTRPAGG